MQSRSVMSSSLQKIVLWPLRLSCKAYANNKEKISMGLSVVKKKKKGRGSEKLAPFSSAEADKRKETEGK